MRLVDNEQFVMGQALKLAPPNQLRAFADKLKKLYVTKWKGYDPSEMCAATLVLEGSAEASAHQINPKKGHLFHQEVAAQEARLYNICKAFGGLPAGEENGRYGYRLTFAIAYIRDLGFDYACLGESFETSVPWDKCVFPYYPIDIN